MAFPEAFVEEVRRTADIVRLISEHVALKKMGASWKGLCPFHQEKTPSFNVRSEPPVFHCFGCGAGGDVFKFVMLHERASFPEAVEAVARRFGVPIPEKHSEMGPDRQQREALFALLEAAAQHFSRNLWTAPGTRAREYLLGRGFRKETLERIRAGAAADSWADLLETLRSRFPLPSLEQAGLVLPKQGGRGHYDRFRNRAVFTILNETGKPVAFGARSLDGSEPKYLNSPESPVYHKGRTLYGLSWARDAVRQQGRLVLMEGYLDVARAIEAGIPEVAAACGTALTSGQARILRRFTERVVLNFDQDEAGQKATRRSADVLLEEGLKVQVVELPPGHDPDSFLRNEGAEAYRRRLAEAPEYMEWLIRRASTENDTNTPSGKAAYLSSLLPALARLTSAVERAAWVSVIAERGRLDEAATREELRRALASGRPVVPPAEAAAAAPPPASRALAPAERWLVGLILQGAGGVTEALQDLEEADLDGLGSAPVLRAARALSDEGRPLTASALEARLVQGDEETRRLLTEVAVQALPENGLRPEDCVRELKCIPLRSRMAQIQKDLAHASGPDQEALLAEKLTLKRRMATL